jgi:hypothetical protein
LQQPLKQKERIVIDFDRFKYLLKLEEEHISGKVKCQSVEAAVNIMNAWQIFANTTADFDAFMAMTPSPSDTAMAIAKTYASRLANHGFGKEKWSGGFIQFTVEPGEEQGDIVISPPKGASSRSLANIGQATLFLSVAMEHLKIKSAASIRAPFFGILLTLNYIDVIDIEGIMNDAIKDRENGVSFFLVFIEPEEGEALPITMVIKLHAPGCFTDEEILSVLDKKAREHRIIRDGFKTTFRFIAPSEYESVAWHLPALEL